MKKIRIGMIGCGMMGSGHLKTLRGLPEYEITAICDIVPEKMEQLHSEGVCGNSVRDFTDYRSLLNSGLCDVVSINTPHPLHTRMSVDAFASGMHVMCDKPIAVSVSEAEQIIAAHRKSSRVFMSMFTMRMDPVNQAIREWILSGRPGKILRVEFTCTAWIRSQKYYDSQLWRGKWVGEGGGLLMNQAPHNLDLLYWWFGDMKSIRASLATRFHRIETEDEVTAVLRTEAGFPIHFYANTWEMPGRNYLEIVGDRGTLVRDGEKLLFKELEIPVLKTIAEHPGFPVAKYEEHSIEVKKIEEPKAKSAWRNLADVLNGNSEALMIPGDEGIHATEFANAMYLSHFSGKEVSLPVRRADYDNLLDGLRSGKITLGKGA